MINWSQVQQLEADIGREDFAEVVTMFLAEVDEAIDQLSRAPPQTPDTLAPALHFLKGSAYNLGFQAFGDFCSDGEKSCLAGQMEQVEVDQVVRLYNSSKSQFLQTAADHCSFRPDS